MHPPSDSSPRDGRAPAWLPTAAGSPVPASSACAPPAPPPWPPWLPAWPPGEGSCPSWLASAPAASRHRRRRRPHQPPPPPPPQPPLRPMRRLQTASVRPMPAGRSPHAALCPAGRRTSPMPSRSCLRAAGAVPGSPTKSRLWGGGGAPMMAAIPASPSAPRPASLAATMQERRTCEKATRGSGLDWMPSCLKVGASPTAPSAPAAPQPPAAPWRCGTSC